MTCNVQIVCFFSIGYFPKHTIYASSIHSQILNYICHCVEKKDENKQKEAQICTKNHHYQDRQDASR